MGDQERAAQLSVTEVMGLQPFLENTWELLTPRAELARPVRWVHTIEDPRPAALLQGQEFVLSTLSPFTENTSNLVPALRAYLDDLDSVQASALGVEVLENRPRLLDALHTVIAERQTGPSRDLPILRFSEQLRFVDITEHFHRFLVARHMAHRPTAESYDPLFEASTRLFNDLADGQLDSPEAAAQRAQVLGMPSSAQYRTLVVRFRPTRRLAADQRARAQQLCAEMVRRAAAQARARALVGATVSDDVGVLLALPDNGHPHTESEICLALRHAAENVRAPDFVPAFVIAAGEPSSNIRDAVSELDSAHQVLRSLETILPRAEKFPGIDQDAADRGCWRASDLGMLGILARFENPEAVNWFVASQLGSIPEAAAPQMRALIRALASPTGTKAQLASQLGISRPTLYSQMRRLQRMIGRQLTDETLQALHLALLLEDLYA